MAEAVASKCVCLCAFVRAQEVRDHPIKMVCIYFAMESWPLSWPLIHLDTNCDYLFLPVFSYISFFPHLVRQNHIHLNKCNGHKKWKWWNMATLYGSSRMNEIRCFRFFLSIPIRTHVTIHFIIPITFTVGSIKLEIKRLGQMFIFITLETE